MGPGTRVGARFALELLDEQTGEVLSEAHIRYCRGVPYEVWMNQITPLGLRLLNEYADQMQAFGLDRYQEKSKKLAEKK